ADRVDRPAVRILRRLPGAAGAGPDLQPQREHRPGRPVQLRQSAGQGPDRFRAHRLPVDQPAHAPARLTTPAGPSVVLSSSGLWPPTKGRLLAWGSISSGVTVPASNRPS